MLIQSPSGKYVDLDEKKAKQWIRKGFRVVPKKEADLYLSKRSDHISKMKEAKKEHQRKLIEAEKVSEEEIYFTTAQEEANGYGTSRIYIKQELQKLGVKVSETFKGQRIGFMYHSPMSVPRLRTKIKILYTMFESDKIPDDWHPYLKQVDKIIVPSEWCAEVFRKAGFYPEVIPLGYNQSIFTYKDRKTPLDENRDFIFLHYNAFNIRKGFPEVLKAFVKEFKHHEPAKMIFKTTLDNPPMPLVPDVYRNIKVLTGKMPERELADLCRSSDCFVFPARGEGFGITPLEAMGTGSSAIIPNAHGISEYFNADCMYEVEVKETCPALYSRWKGVDVGKMVICDIDDLAKKMRWVYEHQKENKEMGEKASIYVKQYSYKKTAMSLKELFDRMKEVQTDYDPDFLELERII